MTVEKTQDEFGNDRFFIANDKGDWLAGPFDTEEQARGVEALCNTCGALKGRQSVGESCNQNCGGKVVANEYQGL